MERAPLTRVVADVTSVDTQLDFHEWMQAVDCAEGTVRAAL